ncbi:MAG: FAD-binding protein [Gemmatimonas sp.]
MSAAKGNPIVIVGAGVAGLIAAIDLQRAGRYVSQRPASTTRVY